MINENAKEKIYKHIQHNKQSTVDDIHKTLNISRQLTHRRLNALLNENKVEKVGFPPKVFYILHDGGAMPTPPLSKELKKFIDNNYLFITPIGSVLEGYDGFVEWCRKNNLPVEKTAIEYKTTLSKYISFKKDGLIDGIKKMSSTFDAVYLDHLYYLDFYSIDRFGKTKLGQKLLYAKQSQNLQLIKSLTKEINPTINTIVKKHHIDAIGFIPPSIKRDVQFMRELQKSIDTALPIIKISKIKTEIVVPQKTLNKLTDRVENAQKTIIVDNKHKFNNILLIDDAVGSGATLNETARQIKEKQISRKVVGLSITGSFKGFDVISEV